MKDPQGPPPNARYDWRDPTELTTEALSREVSALRELFEAKFMVLDVKYSTRLDGMDKALSLLQTIADRMPLDVDSKIAAADRAYQERFNTIQVQFEEQSRRHTQTAVSAREAVDLAFSSSKEAVNKSEASTNKQMDQMGTTLSAAVTTLDGKIGDMKDLVVGMLTRVEGEARFKSQDDKIGLITNVQNRGSGGDDRAQRLWGALGVIAGLIIAGLAVLVKQN